MDTMLEDEVENINADLDVLSENVNNTVVSAWQDVCLVLEENGITVPIIEEFEDEMLFNVFFEGEEKPAPYYLYVAIDPDEHVPGFNLYATLATEEELHILDLIDEDNVVDQTLWEGVEHVES